MASDTTRTPLFLILLLAACDPTPKRTSPWSPCQCKMKGPCVATFVPSRPQDLFADGTHPSDYDDWGFYVGADERVPGECRAATQERTGPASQKGATDGE